MKSNWILSAVALTSCWKASGTVEPRPPTAGNVDVEIASVTLADDCDTPIATTAGSRLDSTADSSMTQAGARVGGGCEQTTMQLSLRSAPAGAQPTQIRIKKVELLGPDHQPLGTLTSRAPTLWTDAGQYQDWNQTIDPGQTLAASYKLSAPDWSAVPGGRWSPATQTYLIRVTLEVGTQERTVEKQAIIRAMMDPDVVT